MRILGGIFMLTSLALIFLIGLGLSAICQKIGLPRIIGMLLAGILLGTHVLNWLDGSILGISADLRQMALVIILIKARLALDLEDLKKVGRPAVLMAFLPALCEIAAFVLLVPMVLGGSRVEAAVIGTVLGAVSPAVVVPRMVQHMEERLGTDKAIPQMILAGRLWMTYSSSCCSQLLWAWPKAGAHRRWILLISLYPSSWGSPQVSPPVCCWPGSSSGGMYRTITSATA